jgi:hypothetical protein
MVRNPTAAELDASVRDPYRRVQFVERLSDDGRTLGEHVYA